MLVSGGGGGGGGGGGDGGGRIGIPFIIARVKTFADAYKRCCDSERYYNNRRGCSDKKHGGSSIESEF